VSRREVTLNDRLAAAEQERWV